MLVRAHDRAVGLLVADRHRFLLRVRRQELEVAEAIREQHLLRLGQVLPGEDEDRVVVEGLLHRLPGGGIHPGEGEIGDDGAQRGIDRCDARLHENPS